MKTVQNKAGVRCQTVRLVKGTTDQYEWGWLVYNRRDRTQDYFNRVGTGTLQEGQQWLNTPTAGARRRVFKQLAVGG